MTDSKSERDGMCRVDDWNFSTETVFRISKLLEDFRHEFKRSAPSLLTRLGSLGDDRLEIDFVRRVFTSPKQDKALAKANIFGTKETSLCFQFTGSSVFETFRKSRDTEHISSAFKKAADLLRSTIRDKEMADVWSQITGLYRKSYRDTTLLGVLDLLEHSIKKLEKTENDDFDCEEQFHILSLLFVFYSRINIAGEASATVSEAHFYTEDSNQDFQIGCPQVFAYLLESESPNTGTDNALLRIDSSGQVRPITNCPTPRPHPVFFPDAGEQIDSINHRGIRKDFLGQCYPIFNEISGNERLFHLVVPVYETDDFSRDDDPTLTHVVAGPFLGWLYILLDENTLCHLLGVSDGEDWDSRWKQLCDGKLELPSGIATELQQLRFALNRFSELYLLGEMEWAIEQPWLEAADAARFTTEHYYNCDGWMQDAESATSNAILNELLNNGYSAFCHLKDGILQVVPNTNQEDYVSHIVVDVGRSFGIDEKGIGQAIPLLFKRRATTSVPIASADREFYRLWVTENIRRFYDMARMLEGERRVGNIAGSLEQAEAVNVAISHEFKKIIPLIPHAPAFVLPHITQWLLAYSLPGLAHIDERHDGHRLPDAIKIHEGANYYQWMNGLVRMAAEIEALSRPGESRHLPDSEQQWAKNVENIQGCFSISESLKSRRVPSLFVVRCLYGAAVLCVLRNTIKATFVHRPFRNPVTKAAAYGEMVFQVKEKIAVYEESGLKNVWSECDLVISNWALEEETKTRRNGGTAGAVNFYLSSIQKSLSLIRPFTYLTPRESENGVHLSRLPLIESEFKSP